MAMTTSSSTKVKPLRENRDMTVGAPECATKRGFLFCLKRRFAADMCSTCTATQSRAHADARQAWLRMIGDEEASLRQPKQEDRGPDGGFQRKCRQPKQNEQRAV